VAFNAYVIPTGVLGQLPALEPNDYIPIVRAHWRAISIWATIGFFLAFAASYLIPESYRAHVVAVPAVGGAGDGLNRMLGTQLAGLGGLLGALPSLEGAEAEAIAVLESRALLDRFIESKGLEEKILEPRGLGRFLNWRAQRPSRAQAVRYFDEKIRSVSEDRQSGIVTLTVHWYDREEAASWANELVALANTIIRETTIRDTRRTLEYLEQAIAKAQSVELRQSLYQVVQAQQRTLALAETRPEYAFRVIDPAVVPDPQDRAGPRRIVVALLGFALFLLASSGYFIARDRTLPSSRSAD